jgi:AraC-like DNA-binding protein/quercetin dioxygenase-like cupin family protein
MSDVAVQRMLWRDLESRADYHAALFSGRVQSRVEPHTHDFFEMFFVLSGTGDHRLNGVAQILEAGDLVFLRPDDCHAITVRPGADLEFVNVAFAAPAWERFAELAQLPGDAFAAHALAPAPVARVPNGSRAICAAHFQRALRAFHQGPSRLDLCAFWAQAMPYVIPAAGEEQAGDGGLPGWLRAASLAMRDPENLRLGVPRFVDLGGVSAAHLSRTFRAHTGQTPTDYVTGLRLERAALLLATTTRNIAGIAEECGFETLSYFYRRFGQRYGLAPRAYRLRAQRSISP